MKIPFINSSRRGSEIMADLLALDQRIHSETMEAERSGAEQYPANIERLVKRRKESALEIVALYQESPLKTGKGIIERIEAICADINEKHPKYHRELYREQNELIFDFEKILFYNGFGQLQSLEGAAKFFRGEERSAQVVAVLEKSIADLNEKLSEGINHGDAPRNWSADEGAEIAIKLASKMAALALAKIEEKSARDRAEGLRRAVSEFRESHGDMLELQRIKEACIAGYSGGEPFSFTYEAELLPGGREMRDCEILRFASEEI